MRIDVKDRFYRVYTYQDVDRVPDLEFGYWPQTIRRWLKEGLPLKLRPEETNDMFLQKIDDFFGFEPEQYFKNFKDNCLKLRLRLHLQVHFLKRCH